MSLPHCEWTASRPRRNSESSMMSSWTSVAVWMNSNRRVQHGAVALVAAEPRSHQQYRGPDPLAAALLDVLPDLRDERDLRLQVTAELALDFHQVVADRLEEPDEIGRRAIDGPVQGALISTYLRDECQRADGGVRPNNASKFAVVRSAALGGVHPR